MNDIFSAAGQEREGRCWRPGGPGGSAPRGRVGKGGGGAPSSAQEAAASMESELEALAPRPASPAEPPFQALVEAAGGRGQVLLVGELWEREQSRALLRDFARAVFPPEPAPDKPGCAEAESAATAAAPEPQGAPGTKAERSIRSPLVFVLCRAGSLTSREQRRLLREMLRDVRGRRREGAALVGVLVADAGAEDAGPPGLQLLETLLRAVFGRQVGGPVQAAAFRPGCPASSLEVQEAACRALQAAGPGRPGEAAWGQAGLWGRRLGKPPVPLDWLNPFRPLNSVVHRGKLRPGVGRSPAQGLSA